MRRERKDDLQTDVAVRRLKRLERENSQLVDEERETGLDVALSDKTNVVKWTVDRGVGFGKSRQVKLSSSTPASCKVQRCSWSALTRGRM